MLFENKILTLILLYHALINHELCTTNQYNSTMKLSICLAVHNESANLHYSIGSVIDWADEIVVVDGESTDDTVTKLRAYGPKVRIISSPNVPMFHSMKQKAIEAAQGDWILQLDADEEITEKLRDEILGIMSNPNDKSSTIAYQVPRKNYFLGQPLMKGGIYPDYTTRLYMKNTMKFPCKDVHENVVPINERKKGEWLRKLENPMNHYSDPTFGRYLTRWKRYTKAEASRVKEKALRLYKNSKWKYMWWKIRFIALCLCVLPIVWFFRSYVRHKGFMDGWQGLVFHFMSAIRWWGIAYFIL